MTPLTSIAIHPILRAVEDCGELGDGAVRHVLGAFPFGHILDHRRPIAGLPPDRGSSTCCAHPDRLAVPPRIPVLDDKGRGLAASDALDVMADVAPILGMNEVNEAYGAKFGGPIAGQSAVGGVRLHDPPIGVGHDEADRGLREGFAEFFLARSAASACFCAKMSSVEMMTPPIAPANRSTETRPSGASASCPPRRPTRRRRRCGIRRPARIRKSPSIVPEGRDGVCNG